MTIAVDTAGLVKLFGATPALVRIALTVPAGTVCALTGANGAGKSTLLGVLSTALRPTLGTAQVHGHDVVRRGDVVRGLVDLLPSAGGAYPELSGEENLRFALRLRGQGDRVGAIGSALDRVGLESVASDPARTYSSGMLRRLGLARVLLSRPAVALVDEPYGALDGDGRALVDELLCDIRASGRTALVATHERGRVERLADALHRLERGVLVDSTSGRGSSSAMSVEVVA